MASTPTNTSRAPATFATDATGIKNCLLNLHHPCFLLNINGRVGATNDEVSATSPAGRGSIAVLATLPPIAQEQIGSRLFRAVHNVRAAYMAGAMAQGIASEQMVIALGRQRLLSAFGAAGLPPARVEAAINTIQRSLPDGPYAFNLIHSPGAATHEQRMVELYLTYGVRTIEASAFMELTPSIVAYRVAGLGLSPAGQIESHHRVIAKISRREVASQFLRPPPAHLLNSLVERALISPQQARLAAHVPMADDITVEADSAGHTDKQSFLTLVPSIIALRNALQAEYGYAHEVRIGGGGGIGTPQAALATMMLGAEYIVTGSINQACREAGTSAHVKQLLAQAQLADVAMAPSADMFELGVNVQLLKKATLFPQRAQKLYDLYKTYASLEAIPAVEREKVERQIFQCSIATVWASTVNYFMAHAPDEITRANQNPKHKMALIFRWYLGMASHWANSGQPGREMDYQIWCGPAMGAFNDWVRGSYLEEPEQRSVIDVAHHIMTGAAYLYRVQQARMQGVQIPAHYGHYQPQPLDH